MTKFKKILIIVCMSVLILSLVVICANAEESDKHSSCVEEHFSRIQEDAEENTAVYPTNNIGNCPYVVISLLLSFYDAYWHDDFIPNGEYETLGRISEFDGKITDEFHFNLENTEWNTLVLQENLNLSSQDPSEIERTQQVYSNFIKEHKDEYFQLYLISLAIEWGYHNGELIYGISDSEMVSFLERYLYEVCGFNRNQVTVHHLYENLTTSNEDVFNQTKECIELGFPVIYGGRKMNFGNMDLFSTIRDSIGGHALVAYDFTDETKNDIFLTPCWNGDPAETFYTTDFKYFSSIIWIELEEGFEHQCSPSYNSLAGIGYCVCDIYKEHPNHTHSYSITKHSETSHWNQCFCGEKTEIRSHNFVYRFKDAGGTHYYYCDCGYSYTTDHLYRYVHYSNSLHRKICDACGDTCLESHHFVTAANPRYSRCHYCGYTRDEWGSGGSAVIMGKKEDEYDE